MKWRQISYGVKIFYPEQLKIAFEMEIRNLENTPVEVIVDALVKSFADYFLQLPDNIQYWQNRFKIARVDLSLSFGMFDGDMLAGFILIGVDVQDDKLTAFNTGTGVLPQYRGSAIVDKLYEHALPLFKSKDIKSCALEVIEANDKAIRVYERIGFSKKRFYRCFKGGFMQGNNKVIVKETLFVDIIIKSRSPSYNSWDHTDKAIQQVKTYNSFEVLYNEMPIGYFVIDVSTGYIPQLDIYTSYKEHWQLLLEGIAQKSTVIKINNIDDRREDLIEALLQIGLDNFINQYEMQMDI